MDDEVRLDGNAIGGLLLEVFGQDMTAAEGCCAACGNVHAVGAMIVYRSGPGDVVRCPTCATVVVVATSREQGHRVYFSALRWLGSIP